MAPLLNQTPRFCPWKLTTSPTNNSHHPVFINNSISTNLLRSCSSLSARFSSYSSSSSISHRPLRYAILGAGFAGLSVAWHLLQQSSREMHLCIDIYDEVGIGGGASGVSGGLLHPYSPKAKLLWGAAECWRESLNLLSVAEDAHCPRLLNMEKQEGIQGINCSIARRSEMSDVPHTKYSSTNFKLRLGILRPATSTKNLDVMNDNAQSCLASCRIESIGEDTVQNLVPNLYIPFDLAFYMPEAVNIHPQHYLEGLFLACENFVKVIADTGGACKEFCLHKKRVHGLLELGGEYDAVIICLGAQAAFLPELSGTLPLRTCRGVVAHLQLDDNTREGFPDHSPSILSDAWLAVQGSRNLHLGSTWEWKSTNYSRNVTAEETSSALEELIPKASAVYPAIKHWKFTGASAGLRGMPPLTQHGSLPLLGCIDDLVGGNNACKYWLFTGLGSRGLLYHGWLGKLTAQAVLSRDEELIPSEFISWKYKMKR